MRNDEHVLVVLNSEVGEFEIQGFDGSSVMGSIKT